MHVKLHIAVSIMGTGQLVLTVAIYIGTICSVKPEYIGKHIAREILFMGT